MLIIKLLQYCHKLAGGCAGFFAPHVTHLLALSELCNVHAAHAQWPGGSSTTEGVRCTGDGSCEPAGQPTTAPHWLQCCRYATKSATASICCFMASTRTCSGLSFQYQLFFLLPFLQMQVSQHTMTIGHGMIAAQTIRRA